MRFYIILSQSLRSSGLLVGLEPQYQGPTHTPARANHEPSTAAACQRGPPSCYVSTTIAILLERRQQTIKSL